MTEAPWTDADMVAWFDVLGTTREARILTIRNLLRYAADDDMSAFDRSVCRKALKQLGAT